MISGHPHTGFTGSYPARLRAVPRRCIVSSCGSRGLSMGLYLIRNIQIHTWK